MGDAAHRFRRALSSRNWCDGHAADAARAGGRGRRGYCLSSVATETCGQLSPLKLSSTVWVYCNCSLVVPFGSFTVSIQKMASICAAWAFGPPAAPCRKAMLAAPPPELGGFSAVEEIRSVVVATMA